MHVPPGVHDISAWGVALGGNSQVRVSDGGTNLFILTMNPAQDICRITVGTHASGTTNMMATAIVEASGQRGAPFYNGLNLGIAAAVACGCAILFFRGAKGHLRSMISGD